MHKFYVYNYAYIFCMDQGFFGFGFGGFCLFFASLLEHLKLRLMSILAT